MTILGDLEAILRDVFAREVLVTLQTTAADIVGWDSFRHVEIIILLEEKYGIELPVSEVNDAKTLGQLAALVERKIATQ
ncbi:acyl carrier protein [Dankookia rubra]|uniref:Acyl carrier protein n=1 Tax=Dankookia rubra TaxID=1442381 RepID=A0A4R5QAD1_9PROT|nr:acyl carrier protein [Dankookia rubra]TDH60000.1 acyl carrier protein [Dankookia rubra]